MAIVGGRFSPRVRSPAPSRHGARRSSSCRPNAEAISQDPHVVAFAPFWRATPKIVFSRSYPGDDWATRVIRGNLQDEVTALKAQPGADLLLTGGASLAAALTDLGLVDEYHIAVHPVVLGGGRAFVSGMGKVSSVTKMGVMRASRACLTIGYIAMTAAICSADIPAASGAIAVQ